jgi:hypothetical protein
MNKTQMINQESSTASDFEFPCKPLLGPSPEVMQPQSSLRVVQGIIVWRQHVRGACSRWKWEVLGWRGLSEAIFALAVPAWHRTVHRTVHYRNYGKLRSSQIVLRRNLQNYGTYSKKRTALYTVQCTGLTVLQRLKHQLSLDLVQMSCYEDLAAS